MNAWSLNPTDEPVPPARIVVVGAGMAGLVAARLLHASGFAVTVLEARSRLGGRLHSDTSLGGPVDLGASWLHGAHANPVARWCRRIDLPLAYLPTGRRRFYEDGSVLRFKDLSRRGWRGLRRAAFAAARATLAARSRGRRASLGSVLEPLLAAESGLPLFDRRLLAWITAMAEGVEGAPAAAIDLAHWYPGEANGVNALPVGGYARLVHDAARGLDVRLDTPVTRIAYGGPGVIVDTPAARFEANAALVTVPLGVLKAGVIAFDPPLPAPKRAAIARIGYGESETPQGTVRATMNKAILRFDVAFWPDTTERMNILPPDPAQRGRFTNWINLTPLLEAPVIMGFATGPAAAHLETCADAEIVAEATANLARISGLTRAPAPATALVTRWLADPWARGAYSYQSIHSSDADRLDYQRPLADRLYFAGEGTQAQDYGTVQAALRSGEQAAAALYHRFAARAPRLDGLPWA
jgi:polyamine oxidase